MYAPDTIFISVDLPAPFSPTTAWTSPGMNWRLTSSRATTPGKRLLMFCTSSSGCTWLFFSLALLCFDFCHMNLVFSG